MQFVWLQKNLKALCHPSAATMTSSERVRFRKMSFPGYAAGISGQAYWALFTARFLVRQEYTLLFSVLPPACQGTSWVLWPLWFRSQWHSRYSAGYSKISGVTGNIHGMYFPSCRGFASSLLYFRFGYPWGL